MSNIQSEAPVLGIPVVDQKFCGCLSSTQFVLLGVGVSIGVFGVFTATIVLVVLGGGGGTGEPATPTSYSYSSHHLKCPYPLVNDTQTPVLYRSICFLNIEGYSKSIQIYANSHSIPIHEYLYAVDVIYDTMYTLNDFPQSSEGTCRGAPAIAQALCAARNHSISCEVTANLLNAASYARSLFRYVYLESGSANPFVISGDSKLLVVTLDTLWHNHTDDVMNMTGVLLASKLSTICGE